MSYNESVRESGGMSFARYNRGVRDSIWIKAPRSTMATIYLLRRVIEKYREKKREIRLIFIDHEKTYDRVSRNIILWLLEKKWVTKDYINVIRNVYEGVVMLRILILMLKP